MAIQWPASTASAEYSQLVLDQIRAGNFEAAFAPVTSDIPGHHGEFRIFADALKIDGVRINVSAHLAQNVADLLGCSLLTPKLADLLFVQRAITVPPFFRQITSSSAAMVDQSKKIDEAIVKTGQVVSPTSIVQTVGKHWVIDNNLLDHPGRAINYGWHTNVRYNGVPFENCPTMLCHVIQGPWWAHDAEHSDYSQNCVLVSRKCVVDGQPMDLQDVLKSPELAQLASQQGVMRVLRQPGIPELPQLFAPEARGASSPFRRVGYGPKPGEEPDRPMDVKAVAWSGVALVATIAGFLGGLALLGRARRRR